MTPSWRVASRQVHGRTFPVRELTGGDVVFLSSPSSSAGP
jgi:hypothetical protein